MEVYFGAIAIYLVIGLSKAVNHVNSGPVVSAWGQSANLMDLIPLSTRMALNELLNRKAK